MLTIKPQRTFWDKIIILHGQRHWFQNRDELYKDGQRLSRHYYDVYRLLASEHGMSAMADLELAKSCADHARHYFDRKPLDLDLATPGTFGIAPPEGMLGPLKEDYNKMAGMIFGEIPPFEDIIERIAEAEATLNTRPKPGNENVGLAPSCQIEHLNRPPPPTISTGKPRSPSQSMFRTSVKRPSLATRAAVFVRKS